MTVETEAEIPATSVSELKHALKTKAPSAAERESASTQTLDASSMDVVQGKERIAEKKKLVQFGCSC